MYNPAAALKLSAALRAGRRHPRAGKTSPIPHCCMLSYIVYNVQLHIISYIPLYSIYHISELVKPAPLPNNNQSCAYIHIYMYTCIHIYTIKIMTYIRCVICIYIYIYIIPTLD